MKYAFIRAHRKIWPAQELCRILAEIARSGYYAWTRGRRRVGKHQRLHAAMHQVFVQSRRTYGSPRVHRELVAQGYLSPEAFEAAMVHTNFERAH